MKNAMILCLWLTVTGCAVDVVAVDPTASIEQGLCVLGGCDSFGCWPQIGECGTTSGGDSGGGATGGGGGGGSAAACDAVNCSTDAQCRPLCGAAAVCVVACNANHPEQCSGWCWP